MVNFPLADWRLVLEEEPRSGAINMAIDEALAESAAAGDHLPTLRFYQWEKPTLSLGRFQPVSDVDEEALAADGVDLVRRSTGGRAILHQDELTYSVTAPIDEPRMTGRVMDAYVQLSRGLVAGLNALGLGVGTEEGSTRTGRDASPACFEIPSAYEIVIHGRKLIGSAQSRRNGYVLQHGTLPLRGRVSRIVDLLALGREERAELHSRLEAGAITFERAREVSRLPGPMPPFEEIAWNMAMGTARTLNLSFQRGQLHPDEIRRAAELTRERYANQEWTFQR